MYAGENTIVERNGEWFEVQLGDVAISTERDNESPGSAHRQQLRQMVDTLNIDRAPAEYSRVEFIDNGLTFRLYIWRGTSPIKAAA